MPDLQLDSNSSIGTPRVFCDIVQYAKAINYVKFYYGRTVINVDGTYADAWSFNPAKTTKFQCDGTSGYPRLGVVFKNSDLEPVSDDYYYSSSQNLQVTSKRDMQFRRMIDSVNYFGLLNHDLGILFSQCDAYFKAAHLGTTTGHSDKGQDYLGSLGSSDIQTSDVGSSLCEVEHFMVNNFGEAHPDTAFPEIFEGLYLQIKVANQEQGNAFNEPENDGVKPVLNLGTITAGRSFDLPHNADVTASIGLDFSGVSRKKTISGKTLTRINNKRPNWGGLTPWTNVQSSDYQGYHHWIDVDELYYNPYQTSEEQARKDSDFSKVSFQGRRTWHLSFSGIGRTDMFPKDFNKNMAGDYEPIQNGYDSGFTWDEDDSIVSTWANMTLGFQIPFIFQPDKNKAEFAIVKGDASSIKIKAQTPTTYNFSIRLIEQF